MKQLAHARRLGAFTLIELLVVIAVVVLLISILLPALGEARKLAQKLREEAAANQNMSAWFTYANDNKDSAFVGYIPWSVAHLYNGYTPLIFFQPDPWRPQYLVEGNVVKVNGLRWLGANEFPLDMHQLHRATLADFRTRPNEPSRLNDAYSPRTSMWDTNVDSLATALAYHPSLGMNSVYVGGSWHRGAFPDFVKGEADGTPKPAIGHPKQGKFYVSHAHEIRNPSTLLQFVSSRGVDIKSTRSYSSTSFGKNPASWTSGAPVVPGFWEVVPPRSGYPTNSTAFEWVPTNKFNPNSNPRDFGFVDARHALGGKRTAVTAMLDGHVESQTISQLRDMRKWANHATSPDWSFSYK